MSSRCENQENDADLTVSNKDETALGRASPAVNQQSSTSGTEAPPQKLTQRRSARRRSVAPKLLEAAAANGSSILITKTKKSTRNSTSINMMSASKEEQQHLPSDSSAAAAPKEQQSVSETMMETATITNSSQLSTEAVAPKEGEKPKEAVVPSSATRRSARTRKPTSSAMNCGGATNSCSDKPSPSSTPNKTEATNPPPSSTRRKQSSRKRGKEEAEAESKVAAVALPSSSSILKTNSVTSQQQQQQQPIDPEDDASAIAATPSNKNATKTVPALSPLPEDATKTVERIKATAQQLFEDGETKVLDRPCVSARLFACYALQSCSDITTETIATDSILSSSSLKPILSLLKALVHIESTSQGPAPLPTSPPLKKRRVLFSAFDCSSTQPPVDRDLESAVHQQESIESMIDAKKVIDTVNPDASPAIQNFRNFLDRVSQDSTLQRIIAAAVAPEFPSKRVASLAEIQHRDFNILHQRLSKLPSDAILSPLQRSQLMMSQPECEPISVEQRLADFLGQAIRFQLRMLLNKAPVRLSTENEAYDQMAEVSYSKVSSVVNAYFVDEEGNNVPVGEGILAAPFSMALQQLTAFFGMPNLLDSSNTPPELPTEFCASEPSQRKLNTRQTCYVPLSHDDVETILQDIEQATSFLAAARAARFLLDLLAAPGVQEEIERMGGWGEIETYASYIWNYDLCKWCPNDAHLLLLCNPAALHRRLPNYCDAMEQLTEGCLASLEQLHSNLRLSTKTKNLLEKFPQIPHIANSYAEGMELAEAFPLIETA